MLSCVQGAHCSSISWLPLYNSSLLIWILRETTRFLGILEELIFLNVQFSGWFDFFKDSVVLINLYSTRLVNLSFRKFKLAANYSRFGLHCQACCFVSGVISDFYLLFTLDELRTHQHTLWVFISWRVQFYLSVAEFLVWASLAFFNWCGKTIILLMKRLSFYIRRQ